LSALISQHQKNKNIWNRVEFTVLPSSYCLSSCD